MCEMDFSQARINYNNEFRGKEVLPKSLCTVDGTFVENISIKDVNGNPNEEYYKWEFIYSLISSGKIPSRDYIGAEIYFPKGNIHSAPIKIDSVIFSDIVWIDYYRNYRANPKDVDSLKKVRELAIGVIEYKRNDKSIEQVFSSQIRASIKEPENPFVLGIYYDTGRLFLFKKIKDEITRFDNSLSFPNSQKILEQYQLEITDPYYSMKKKMDMSSYDEILLGFPIWWYVAPTIINTFLEAYDFSGKKIVLFATSGGSGFGNTVKELQSSASDAIITEGRLLNCGTKQEITEWVNSL